MTTEEMEKKIQKQIKKIKKMGYKKTFLGVKEVMHIIGVSESTLYNWRKNGVGPEYSRNNSPKARIRYRIETIARFMIETIETA